MFGVTDHMQRRVILVDGLVFGCPWFNDGTNSLKDIFAEDAAIIFIANRRMDKSIIQKMGKQPVHSIPVNLSDVRQGDALTFLRWLQRHVLEIGVLDAEVNFFKHPDAHNKWCLVTSLNKLDNAAAALQLDIVNPGDFPRTTARVGIAVRSPDIRDRRGRRTPTVERGKISKARFSAASKLHL